MATSVRLELAGQRPSASIADRPLPSRQLDLGLLGNLERVVNLDAKVPHGAFQFRMAQEQLHGSQVPGSGIDQRWLGTPNRMRSTPRRIKSDLLEPAVQNASVLPCAEVRRQMQSARETGSRPAAVPPT